MPAQRKRECFHSLSVRLRQPEQSRLAQTVEQLVELCNDVVRTGCVCYRCRCFRTCTGWACRAGRTNCACFTPNTGRIDDILRLAREYQVDGVIDVNLKFCCLYDTEGYTVEKALKEAGIPVLGIETDYTDTDAEQLRTRVEAFVEMLG